MRDDLRKGQSKNHSQHLIRAPSNQLLAFVYSDFCIRYCALCSTIPLPLAISIFCLQYYKMQNARALCYCVTFRIRIIQTVCTDETC